MSKRLIIDKFKQNGIIQFGDFVLKSGMKSKIYFDLRKIMSYPDLMADVSLELSKLIPERDVVVAGVPMGAISYASNISQILNIPMIMIRESRKEHGLQKLIEGDHFNREVILVEDVITTGTSILNTIKNVESEGLKVRKVIAILDRNSGGVQLIKEKGYPIQTLFTMDEIMNHTPTKPDFIVKNTITKKLIELIETKKTNLIVSLDLDSPTKILNILGKIGDHICAVKLHFDLMDFTIFPQIDFGFLLKHMADDKKFLIIEDRKYADIPFISLKQHEPIKSYCDFVTVHGICGEDLINEFNKQNVGVLLVHRMSTKDNLIDNTYSNKIKNIGLKYDNVVGFVSQGKVAPGYLTFTPGINLAIITDQMGQKYNTVDNVDTDIFIVGRGIYESENILETTILYKETCFKKWKSNH